MAIEEITPIGEYILIGVESKDKTTESGLILSTNEVIDNRGVVKAVGDKVNTDKDSTQINIGDTILFLNGGDIKVNNSETSDALVSIKNVIGLIRGDK